MNRITTGLLGLTALFLVGFGIERIVFWLSRPLGPQLGAGETFGIVVGLVIVALGALAGFAARAVWHDARGGWIATAVWAVALIFLAYIALSTPEPAPVPIQISVGAAVIGLALAGLAGARAVGRVAP